MTWNKSKQLTSSTDNVISYRNETQAPYSKGVRLAYVLAVINAVVIGITFMFAKMSLDYASPFDTLTLRFAAAFFMLIIPVVLGFIKLSYRGKPIYKLLILATMYPIGFFTFQTYGLQHATSAEGGILNAFTPVLTMVLASVFLKEATTLLQKLSTLLSVSGVAFIFLMKGSGIDLSNLSGIILLLVSCLLFAGYSVLTRSISKHFSLMEISLFMVGSGFAATLLASIAIHSASGSITSLVVPLANGAFILLILYLGAVQLSTALMGSYVLSKIQASKMGVFINLSTIVSIVAGTVVLGEEIAWYHLLGSVFIIAGVIGTNLTVPKKVSRSIVSTNHLGR